MSDSTSTAPTTRIAWGQGWATVTANGDVLDTWYPHLGLGDTNEGSPQPLHEQPNQSEDLRAVRCEPCHMSIDLDEAPTSVPDAYLRLHLLSTRTVAPHSVNVTGIFAVLPNVAWTSLGPCEVEKLDQVRFQARRQGVPLQVHSVDKFPRMTDYVVPSGVRIGDADRVRLGAHLAHGTTVMHEGFVNFNAGTLGASMVEGRISAGVVVGEGTDIGGGSSIMGTLSGGGREVISLGKRCLLGANAGLGISLGDDCIVEAGCYVTAGSKINLLPGSETSEQTDRVVVKANELSGQSGLLFRRNSLNGSLEALRRPGLGDTATPSWGGLNPALHS